MKATQTADARPLKWLYEQKMKLNNFCFHKQFSLFSKLLDSTVFYLWVMRAQFEQFWSRAGAQFSWILTLNRCLPVSLFNRQVPVFMFRSGHKRCFMKKPVFKNFAMFTGKHLCWSLFLIKWQARDLQIYQKETPTRVFCCEYCEIFKSTYFDEHQKTDP